MMKIKKTVAIGLLLVQIMLYWGCGKAEKKEDIFENGPAESFPQREENGDDGSKSQMRFEKREGEMIVTQEMGTVRVPLHPRKIAALDLGLLDTVLAYSEDCTFLLPRYEVLPEHLKEVGPVVYAGTPKEPDFEAVRSFAPDVILISARMTNHYNDLNEIAPVVFSRVGVSTCAFAEEMNENTRLIAALFGAEAKAERDIAEREKRQEALRKKTLGRSVLLIVTGERGMLLYDDMSIYGFLYNDFGFSFPMASDPKGSHGKPVTMETLSKVDVDYVFTFDRGEALGTQSDKGEAMRRELADGFAARGIPVLPLDAATWYLCQNGVHGFQRVLEEVEKGIGP